MDQMPSANQWELRVLCKSKFYQEELGTWQQFPSELDGAGMKAQGFLFLSRIFSKVKCICRFSGIFGVLSTAQCSALFAVLNT